MLTDIEIASRCHLEPIQTIADVAGIDEKFIEPYGKYKAKIDLGIFQTLHDRPQGKLVLVTAITPTKAGEGKTTTTIGLGQALVRLGKRAMICLREPSMGPVFGLKGGAAGGGYSQVVPMADINLHFTGDMHALTAANNLVSAIIDNHIFQGNELHIDPQRIVWRRAMDMNDRALRDIDVAKGDKNGMTREDHFQITVASEMMAILCLSTSYADLRQRLSRVIVAYTVDQEPITIERLGIVGSLMVILKDALMPNLVQTLEHTPVFIHGGPFANIAHGANSILATNLALKLSDIVVTEAGFGADLGAEKFMHITAPSGGFSPQAVVIVATIRALKMHGGVAYEQLKMENVDALIDGMSNLQKHIETVQAFGVPYVVAINRFPSDTEAEIQALHHWCQERKHPVALSEVFTHGGEGGLDLARLVLEQLSPTPVIHQRLYSANDSFEQKVLKVAQTVYGANAIEMTPLARQQIDDFTKLGYGHLPVCMAKTQMSLSDDPKLLGRPTGFTIHVQRVSLSAGAGFIVAYTGSILTMPGLPKHPAALDIVMHDDGTIEGLS